MNVVFLDRDGTLIHEPPDQQVDSLEKLELIPGVIQGLLLLARAGFELVMVSNQDSLGSPAYPREVFESVQGKLLRIFEGEGIRFAAIFICPHGRNERCSCRKPEPGLVAEYVSRFAINADASYVVGDRHTDVEFAKRIGCRSILLATDGGTDTEADLVTAGFLDACRHIVRSRRSIRFERRTLETTISVEVALDGVGSYKIETGIGFFDHMLAQLARHSGIDMSIAARGDLSVDEHHTVEDTGLALGEALRRALGEKRGIERYGFMLPMDDALAQVAIDLGGRPYLDFDARFRRERLGELPTELIEEFFRAFSNGLGANIHIKARGRNEHHIAESIFKGVARTLKSAVAISERTSDLLPTTKGEL